MDPLTRLSATELRSAYLARELSPVEVIEALAKRIEEVEPRVNAFTTVSIERALIEAKEAEHAYRGDVTRPLEGLPLGVKDLFDTEGVRTTYGSPLFADHVPAADSAPVARARAAGAILLGKTSTHEFAWGITSVNPHFGASRNPWALDRISGGSSGGSAVALAAHEAPLTLASDTGGSIRVPAGFCGIVGLKPTYGRISAAGVFPLAPSLDHVGVMARTPRDAAMLLGALAGADPNDPATEDIPLGDVERELASGLSRLRVAVCPDLNLVQLAPDIQAVFDETVRVVETLGATVVAVDFPEADLLGETFAAIQRAEAFFVHQRAGLFPDRRESYGADVAGRLELGSKVTIAEYLAAAADRRRLRTRFALVFSEAHLLLTPVCASSPIPIGDETLVHLGKTIDFRELVMGFTVPQDLAGLPACAVRAGFDALGIPVGVQFTGPRWAEARVLRAAQALHAATEKTQSRWPEL